MPGGAGKPAAGGVKKAILSRMRRQLTSGGEAEKMELLMNDNLDEQKTMSRAEPQPLAENFRSAQPGGGVCYQIELAWGRWRRWTLTHFWPGYVKKMADLRQGDCGDAPHAIIDPRDL